MARIRLHNMMFYGYHGVSKAERETGRRFEVDCELDLDVSAAAQHLGWTPDYTMDEAFADYIADMKKETGL